MRVAARAALALALGAAALALAACQPEPAATSTPSASATPAPTSSATPEPGSAAPGATDTPAAPATPRPSASPAPSAPAPAPSAGALPADCRDLYSPAMYDALLAEFGQLNPDVTFPSTEVADVLDVLQGAPSLSCLWTPPGKTAISTNVALVTPEQARYAVDAFNANFIACEEDAGQTVCQASGSQFENTESGEYHVLRGDLLVTTHWLNTDRARAAVDDLLARLPD